jgi:predicted PurR-regulated permease PerM
VWIAFGICVLILTIVGAIANIGYLILPLLLLFFGMPTFISGCISKFTPFITGGIICWILSIFCFLYKSEESLLLVAAGAVVAWIIPGFILRTRFNRSRKLQHGV